jgi:hypothetical protein
VASRHIPAPGNNRLSLAAWVRWNGHSILIDTRTSVNDGQGTAGLVWHISTFGRERTPCIRFRNQVSEPQEFHSTLDLPQDEWIYVGLDLDTSEGIATIYINDRSEKVKVTSTVIASLKGDTAYIGFKRSKNSSALGLYGDIRFMGMFDKPIGITGHRYLYDRFAADIGRKRLGGGSPCTAKRLLWLDPTDPQFTQEFIVPDGSFQGVRVATENEANVLRFFGEGSAGVDLDENHRAQGDKIQLRFRFKIETGNNHVICTVGDADEPARLIARNRELFLVTENQKLSCGKISHVGWAQLQITTFANTTRAQLGNQTPVEVTHNPRGTWVYLGQGYQISMLTPDDQFVIDIESVQSRVTQEIQ